MYFSCWLRFLTTENIFFYASNHDLVKEASVYKLVKEELHVPHLEAEMLTLLENDDTNQRGQACTTLQI